jgi:NAD(P)H-dependent FMN reductase
MTRPLGLALIYGSARPGRLCDTVARWVASQVHRHPGFALDIIDPAAGGLDMEDDGFRRRIDEADAFLIVTPEYNHSYLEHLRTLIDPAYKEWQAKPVAFVSYGGVSGGRETVEHLRGVFVELHAVSARDWVSFPHARASFDSEGHLLDEVLFTQPMDTLLSRLGWWARALKAARQAEAYGAAA